MNNGKLYRSDDAKIAGVMGGIAEYFEIDPTIVRLCYALLTFFSLGIPGVVFYAVAALIIPKK